MARAETAQPRAPRRRSLWPAVRTFIADMLVVAVPLALGVVAVSVSSGPPARLRDFVFDVYQRLAPRDWSPDLPVRIVDIDDESLARVGQWPWSRTRIAELSDRIAKAGAAVVAWDVLFAEEDRQSLAGTLGGLPDMPERDALAAALQARGLLAPDGLAQAIARVPTVLATSLIDEGGATHVPPKWGLAAMGDAPEPFVPGRPRVLLPLPDLAKATAGLGLINYIPDGDLVVRRAPLFLRLGTGKEAQLVPSLALEALRLAMGASTYQVKASNASGETAFGAQTGIVAVRVGDTIIPTEPDGELRIRFAGFQPGRHVPAWKVFAGEIPPGAFDGRIVFVGPTAAGLNDLRATPLADAVPGVDQHAEVVEHVVSGARLARPDWAPGLEMIALALVGIVVAWSARLARPLSAALGLAFFIATAIGASWLSFLHADLLFDPVIPSLSWIATFLLLLVATYRRTERERRAVRLAFSRYLAPAVVEQLAADPRSLRLGGEARTLSILFCDVRNFTRRAETMAAREVVEFLNDLHTPLTNLVLAEQGTIDKYIGDGLMAFWNAPLDVPAHAARACRAALAMQAAVPAIDAKAASRSAARGKPHVPVAIGIGLNTGDVFVGNMGSEQRFDYSIVGDPVNVGARLESTTKEFGVPIVVSESTAAAAPDFLFVDLGSIGLKGKSESARVLALHGPPEDASPAFDAFLRDHRAALVAVLEGAPDARRRVDDLRRSEIGARYATFYDRLMASGHEGEVEKPVSFGA